MLYADLFDWRDVTRHGLTSDARSIQTSSQNIRVSRKANMQADTAQ